MWDALIKQAEPVAGSRQIRQSSMMTRIRAYLVEHPHRTATQVARELDITPGQSNTALDCMAKRGYVNFAFDASTERTRQVKHFSVAP